MFKISRYNHFQPWSDGHYIAYNARTGAIGLMTEDNYTSYRRLVERLTDPESDNREFTPEESHLIQQLQHGCFLYPDHQDELAALRFDHQMSRFDRRGVGLSIAPTLACNMACKYCYEADKEGKMQAETIEAILDFVERRASNLRAVDVNWYGGEPLLAMDVIEDLTESLLDLGEEYKFVYTGSIVTNGYLLTPETVDRLVDLKITSAQITLDGPARLHNQKRPLKNGRESFGTIVENAAYASRKIATSIRVNVDKSFSTDVVAELLSELDEAGIKDRAGIYFGRLEASTSVCSNIAESCYDAAGFSRIETEFYPVLLSMGFQINNLPAPLSTVCIAQQVNSFLLDPAGYIYRCYNHIGDVSKSMGNIKEEIDYQNPNFTRLFDFDPFEDERCRTCTLLPVCLGGCPARRADMNMKGDELCETWKHNLEPMLEIIVRSRRREAQPSAKE